MPILTRRGRRPPISLALLLAPALLGAPPPVLGEQKPLWEVGLGVGALGISDYRGSESAHVYPLPVPYVVYRGEYLRADDQGVRGLLFHGERARLNVSLSATPPADSSDNEARQGMADLDPTLELGPSLELRLWHSSDRRRRLEARFPVRNAVTIDASPRSVGWVFSPRLNLDLDDFAGHEDLKLGLLAGPLFADTKYHQYFYGVPPAFATPDRPAYDAQGGYSGAQLLVSLTRRFPKYWMGAYARYDRLDGAVFEASPLVRRKDFWTAGVGFAWMVGKSARLVDVDIGEE